MNDILSSEGDMIISNHFYMTLENKDELDAYVYYLTYRVQRDLYELLHEDGQFCDMSWQEFVWDIRQIKQIRNTAAMVVRETLKNFRKKGHFNFDVKEVELFLDSEIGRAHV